MLNNRKCINLLEEGNERLKRKVGLLKDLKEFYKRKNIELQADIEVKENSVCNLLETNKELSLHNNYLENQNLLLNKENVKLTEEINQKDRRLKNQRINLKNYREQIERLCEEKSMSEKELKEVKEKNSRLTGQLDKIDNYTRMLDGRGINE